MKDWHALARKLGAAYLSAPYTHSDLDVVAWRVEQIAKKRAELVMLGYVVFSPICHSDPFWKFLPAEYRFDHELWMEQDLPWIRHCNVLFVYDLPGWEQSRGVKREMEEAWARQVPVQHIPYEAAA